MALRFPFLDSLDLSLRRVTATSISIAVHIALLWVLLNRLGPAAEPQVRDLDRATTFALMDLSPPGAPEPSPAMPAAASVPLPLTPVDLSVPADLPAPEWSVARMLVARSAAIQTASADAPAGGGGGARTLRKFIGFGDGKGGELLLDKAKLEDARQLAVRAFPDAHGTVMVFLRISPAGIVLAAEIKGGGINRALTTALSDALVGQKLFQVRVPVQDSALVFLPPFNLAGES